MAANPAAVAAYASQNASEYVEEAGEAVANLALSRS
jgi:hypothetical protein